MDQRLTRRELQCVRLAGESLSNKEIAVRLKVSPSTVNNHLSNAYAKLSTSDRIEASRLAARDYPDFSRLLPIPMEVGAEPELLRGAPGDARSDEAKPPATRWMLPVPPEDLGLKVALVMAFAIAAVVVTIGLVAIVGASLSTFAIHAPSNAVLAQDVKDRNAHDKV